jgi:hypothetical protein
MDLFSATFYCNFICVIGNIFGVSLISSSSAASPSSDFFWGNFYWVYHDDLSLCYDPLCCALDLKMVCFHTQNVDLLPLAIVE